MRKHNDRIIYKSRQKLFFIVVGLLIFVSLAYVYFLCASVQHVVIQQEIDQDIITMRSHLSELESKYIDAQYAVSKQYASQVGYVAVSDKIYIEQHETSLALSDHMNPNAVLAENNGH